LTQEALDRRLLKFFREARTFEEEQGVNILFLAIGFLNWFEDDRSDEQSSAPLVLVPTSLERRQGRDLFVLRGRDDDIIVNVSLAEKLRGTFGIVLPDLPESDEWLPSAYLNSVATAVASQKRWEIDRLGIGLGFFTFSKFLMWRDLAAAAWPDAGSLLKNALLTKLLGEDLAHDPEPALVSDEEPIDQRIDLASAIHVVDADSSQATCIEEARRGRNLVVQGPPGTGKSQTIANIIATAAHDGKSILFVAEKAAALDVVYSRLKAVGLEPLCLEIHSRKATKLSVINALDRSIRASSVSQVNNRNAQELRAARDRLNNWSAALHCEIRHSGRTPYQVMGAVLKLRADGVRVLGQRLDAATTWDLGELKEAERAVDRASVAVSKLGAVPIRHAWYGTLGSRLTPFDLDRLKEALRDAQKRAQDLTLISSRVAVLLQTQPDMSCIALQDFAKSLRLLAQLPEEGRSAFKHAGWRSERKRIAELVENGKLWSSSNAELADVLVDPAWRSDACPVRLAIAAHGKSIFRSFAGRYQRALADLRSLCREKPPRRLQDRLVLLDKLIAAQSARRKLEDEEEFGQAALGPVWASERTQWTIAEGLLAWADKAEHENSNLDLLALAPSVDHQSCATLASELEWAVAAFLYAYAVVADFVRPNIVDILGVAEVEQALLSSISATLDKWGAALQDFDGWVSAREALEALSSWKMEMLAEGLRNGNIHASEAKPMADLLIAEALWHCACLDNPTLDEIDGTLRSEVVSEFCILDRRRIELTRSEVLAGYLERRPNGESGEMAVVKAEIGKKRRHLPIRKLIERAGSAVQRLKPVFLMSPLSVAQFLPPGRLGFDLVVIDEASQVPPEEAFGVVARGKQMIIVGDDKQLPPTNFFRIVSVDEDDDGQDEVVTPSARTRDFESVLTLSRARGTAERMLRWHYRSRHPSLIAMSNHSCYGGALLLPPSPGNDDKLGLSLVKTPRGHYDRGGSGRNPVEADMIAEAVEEHISKHPTRSLGIACFSVAQRDAIYDALQRRGVLVQAEAFNPKEERLFIKNLEAVQGDERDVVLISIGYGPDAQGRMTAGFGPLSADGGERRLNVLISRARERCIVFSSITAGDIPAEAKPRGTRMLREFLHFAETGHIAAGQVRATDFDSSFEEAVAIAIRRNGYEVLPQVGVSGFRVDLGVLDPEKPGRFVLGIECDGAAYHSSRSARDRDRLRQEVLENLGWVLYRIWSTDWFRSPDRQIERLLSKIKQTLACDPAGSDPSPRVIKTESDGDIKGLGSAVIPPEPKSVEEPQSAEGFYEDLSEPYQEYELRVPRTSELLDMPQRTLLDMVETVVRFEGPIHAEEVARRIREAFGLERTGRRILETISGGLETLVRQGSIAREGEFWSQANIARQKPRSRRDAALSLRRPDRIAAQEYRLAINAILRGSVASSKSELTASVARVLGFDRTGHGLDRAISDQIDCMIRTGAIADTGGRLEITRQRSG
jgi:very-short-patch-repair endonuclease